MKQHNILSVNFGTLWGNTDVCAEHYIYVTVLFLLSILSQDFYVIIGCGISAPGHNREVVYLLNTTEKRFFFQLMCNVQLPGGNFITHIW